MTAPADRTGLQRLAREMLFVADKAPEGQWAEWLRVPLEHAARTGNIELVRALLRSGAIGSTGWHGGWGVGTLLGAGAERGSEEVAIALLQAGATAGINAPLPEHGNGTVLHMAVARGAEGAARALMLAGADVDATDDQGRTPLHLVAESGHHRVVGDLLFYGAQAHVTDENGNAAIHLAAEGGHWQSMLVLLVNGVNQGTMDAGGRTPLARAVIGDSVQAAKILLAFGANVNHRSSRGTGNLSALDIAARNAQVEMVRLLLSRGADVSSATNGGCTPLLFAASGTGLGHDNRSVIRDLIEAGADIEARGPAGWTVFLYAVKTHRSCIGNIRVMLEGGANVNFQDSFGMTALQYACLMGDVEMVELLLRWGADEAVTSDAGRKAVDEVGVFSHSEPADNERIRSMLARARADKSWRRRRALVLCRSCPDRVSPASGKGGGQGAGDESMVRFGGVVARVVGLEADDIFRAVVSYL